MLECTRVYDCTNSSLASETMVTVSRRHLVLCMILLGVFEVVYWRHNTTRGPMELSRRAYLKRIGVSDIDIDQEIGLELNLCSDLNLNNNAARRYHQTLKSRLAILQEYVPNSTNFSKTYDNPCWYDSHEKLSSRMKEVSNCHDVLLSYRTKLPQASLRQIRMPGESHLYCLPAFYLLGFPRSASTTLYKKIMKHPLIADTDCIIKESHFWSRFMNKHGTDLDKRMQVLHYLNYFSQALKTIESNPRSKILDGSVSSLIWTSWTTTPYTTESEFCILPSLFKRVLPEAKFVVIMRNPTERTFSHYYYYSVIKATKVVNIWDIDNAEVFLSFHKYALEAIEKFYSCVDGRHSVSYCVRLKGIDGNATNENDYVGIQTSLYYYHIVPWLSIIPRKRFLFLRTEDLAYAPQLTMTKVWNFLNLDDLEDNANKKIPDLQLPLHTKVLLDDFFRPYNQLLAHLLSDMRFLWID